MHEAIVRKMTLKVEGPKLFAYKKDAVEGSTITLTDNPRDLLNKDIGDHLMVMENDNSIVFTLRPDLTLEIIKGVIDTLKRSEATIQHHMMYNKFNNLQDVNETNQLSLLQANLLQSINVLQEVCLEGRKEN